MSDLGKILTEDPTDGSVRWGVGVPLITNPFILVDLARFVLVAMFVILVMAAIPQWAYAGEFTETQVLAICRLCLWGAALFAIAFAIIGGLFFRNRFYAVYVLNDRHIYYENVKGRDGGFFFIWNCRPFPMEGSLDVARRISREISWSKVDSFVDFPGMRTILLKRGMWEILKLYTPDEAVHSRVSAFLGSRLKKRNP